MPGKKGKSKSKTPKKGSGNKKQLDIDEMLSEIRSQKSEDEHEHEIDDDDNESEPGTPGSPSGGFFITKENLESLLDRSADRALNKAIDFIKNEIKKQVAEKTEKLEGEIFELKNEKDDLKKDVSALQTKLRTVQAELATVKSNVDEMRSEMITANRSINHLEQYSRKSCVRVFGVPEKENEQCKELICEIAREKMKTTLELSEIDAAHRIGKKDVTKVEQKRPIIVRLVKRESKEKLMKNKKNLKGSGYSVFDDLTTANHKLLMSAKDSPYLRDAWFTNGKVIGESKFGGTLQLYPDTEIKQAVMDKKSKES